MLVSNIIHIWGYPTCKCTSCRSGWMDSLLLVFPACIERVGVCVKCSRPSESATNFNRFWTSVCHGKAWMESMQGHGACTSYFSVLLTCATQYGQDLQLETELGWVVDISIPVCRLLSTLRTVKLPQLKKIRSIERARRVKAVPYIFAQCELHILCV